MKKTLNVTTYDNALGANYHAGEFTLEGRYFCAAHVPTRYGFRWELEEKTVPLNQDGGWVKVPATFNHNRRKATLEISW
jgi:hypothetical protein